MMSSQTFSRAPRSPQTSDLMNLPRRHPPQDRPTQILALQHTPEAVADRSQRIHDALLKQSPQIRHPNFTAIDESDLRLLFDLYDFLFFSGLLSGYLRQDAAPFTLRLSSRLTSAAGKTFFHRKRVRTLLGPRTQHKYEIAVSSLLLFQTFQGDHPGRTVIVGGLTCRSRLEALQRVFEHELLHLTEFLAWGRSSCAEPNFHALSRQIFAHAGVRHNLVTPREVAAYTFNLKVGDRVQFTHDRLPLQGLLNRITKRATVLVEAPQGRRYSDGKTYITYYVPLPSLEKSP